jgi:hypothetical protein
MSFHASIMNITEVAREEYIDDCEYLIGTIEKRATQMIIDAAVNYLRHVTIDISDLEEDESMYEILFEKKYDDIDCVADRVFASDMFEGFTISFEDEHQGLIVISW